jgi:hypothetical protein
VISSATVDKNCSYIPGCHSDNGNRCSAAVDKNCSYIPGCHIDNGNRCETCIPWRQHSPGEAGTELKLGVSREMDVALEPGLRRSLASQGSVCQV